MTEFLQHEDLKALLRFNETVEDDNSYDVPKEMMSRLSQIGVVQHTGRGSYSLTSFGRYVVNIAINSADRSCLPLKTYSDYNIEYFKRISSMRSGANHD